MADKAESNRVRVSFVRESVFSVPEVTPTYQIARLTNEDLAANKQTVTSDELRSDRMVSDQPEVGFDTGGSISVEYSGQTYKDWIEAAMCGTFDASPTDLTDAAVTATAPDTYAATGIETNASVGDWLYFNMDFTDPANNGWKQVTATGAGSITVSQAVTNDSASTGHIGGENIINGVEKRSYEVEKGFTDIAEYMRYSGMRLGTWDVSLTAGEIVTGSFAFMGTQLTTQSDTEFGSTYTPASTTPVMNATSNVGEIVKDGAVLATCIQSISFTVENNLRSQMCVGSKFPSGIGYGRQLITGTLTAYFEDLTLFNEMLSHDDVSLVFSMYDICLLYTSPSPRD